MTGWKLVNEPNIFGSSEEPPYALVFVRDEQIGDTTHIVTVDAEVVALKPVSQWADFLEAEWQHALQEREQ